jgi:hypothetical protein
LISSALRERLCTSPFSIGFFFCERRENIKDKKKGTDVLAHKCWLTNAVRRPLSELSWGVELQVRNKEDGYL